MLFGMRRPHIGSQDSQSKAKGEKRCQRRNTLRADKQLIGMTRPAIITTILYYYNDCTNCQGKNLNIYEWNSLSPLVHSYPIGTTRISRSKISNSQSRLLTVHRAKIKI